MGKILDDLLGYARDHPLQSLLVATAMVATAMVGRQAIINYVTDIRKPRQEITVESNSGFYSPPNSGPIEQNYQ